jgi:ADP-heptose:LPS heptosyltransferase
VPGPPDAIHQVERNLQLIEAVGFPVRERRMQITVPPAAAAGAAALRRQQGLAPAAPYLLLCPWASCEARTYFPRRFAAAARQLATATGWPVLVAGGPRDVARRAEILDELGPAAVDLVGQTSVPELAALVQSAPLLLTNDSLPMHLAAATGTPAVILYAGTELESQWAPRYAPHRLLRRPTPCTPCYRFHCPFARACLDFEPSAVAAAGLELLELPGSSPCPRKS